VRAEGRDDAGRRGRPLRRSSPAAHVALAQIGAQVEQIRAQDGPVRLDLPGAVHAMRVATRRLRSALKTFRPLLHRDVTRPVRDELRWLARVLGTARDAEVMRERVLAAVEREGDQGRSPGAVTDEARGQLAETYAAARRELLVELDGDRYRALRAALDALLDDPPLRKRAARRAGRVLPRLVARADAEARAAMTAARRAEDHADRQARLHDARKAAKRARYAAEAVAPALGKDARRLAAAMERLQDALGEHLDTANTRTRLHELAARTTAPSAAFTYGRLDALEEVRSDRTLTDVDAAWRRARRKRLRRWLR
jgi:CHAD domain-containing protein